MFANSFRNCGFKSKFADVVALNDGDATKLQVEIDAESLRKIGSYRDSNCWGDTVLVLGGSGFVGIHLLYRLLQDERVKRVYTLVRRNSMLPMERLRLMMAIYGLNLNAKELEKLYCLEGTITAHRFGLSEMQYKYLCHEIDTVFQCASSTDYSVSYLDLRTDWVVGLLRIVQLCIEGKIKQLTYLGSTIARLYSNSEDFIRPDSWWYSGYAQMKWVNQNILANLASSGLRITICEAPYILGSTSIGKDPGLHYSYWRIAQVVKSLKMIWDGEGSNFVPVDILVNALVDNALNSSPLLLLRPCNPLRYQCQLLAPLLECEVVSWDEFYTNVCKTMSRSFRRMICADLPQLIQKTNTVPIYQNGFDANTFPSNFKLMSQYIRNLQMPSISSVDRKKVLVS